MCLWRPFQRALDYRYRPLTIYLPRNCTSSPLVRAFVSHGGRSNDCSIEAPTTETAVSDPQGQVENPFSYPLSQDPITPLSGGTVKTIDSTKFKVATTIAAADVTVEPGAIRELHWHPTQYVLHRAKLLMHLLMITCRDEWTFFL